jgi:hypothetical protein
MASQDMEVACPSCGKKYVVPISFAGKTDCCSGCGSSIKIPESAPQKLPSVTQIMSMVVPTPYGKFKNCIVRNSDTPHMVCMVSGERLRVPLIAPMLAPVLDMLPAEVGPLLNHADGVVVECRGTRVTLVVQFFTDKGYPVFVVPSAVVPAPATVRSVAPCGWGPDGLKFQMLARPGVETIPWKAVRAIGVTTMVREVTTIISPADRDRERGSRIGPALGNMSGTVASNLLMGPAGVQSEEVPDPGMVSLLVENDKLPSGQLECLECDERHVKYEFLGSRMVMGGSQNFMLFVRDLLEQLPEAFVPDNVRAVAAGERRIRVIQNRRSLAMYRRWMLACDFARKLYQKSAAPAP